MSGNRRIFIACMFLALCLAVWISETCLGVIYGSFVPPNGQLVFRWSQSTISATLAGIFFFVCQCLLLSWHFLKRVPPDRGVGAFALAGLSAAGAAVCSFTSICILGLVLARLTGKADSSDSFGPGDLPTNWFLGGLVFVTALVLAKLNVKRG